MIALGALAELFSRQLSKASLQMAVAAVSSLTDEETERAAALAASKCKFMPAPAELIELARTGGASYEARANIAFDELTAALRNYHPDGMQKLPTATQAVVRTLGGWETLGQTPLSDLYTWKRKEFLRTYTTLLREDPERLAALASGHSGLIAGFKTLPSRADLEKIEAENRRQLQYLGSELAAATSPPAAEHRAEVERQQQALQAERDRIEAEQEASEQRYQQLEARHGDVLDALDQQGVIELIKQVQPDGPEFLIRRYRQQGLTATLRLALLDALDASCESIVDVEGLP